MCRQQLSLIVLTTTDANGGWFVKTATGTVSGLGRVCLRGGTDVIPHSVASGRLGTSVFVVSSVLDGQRAVVMVSPVLSLKPSKSFYP